MPSNRLHLIGIFHTLAKKSSSHCAFTGKALRFAAMMQNQGFEVIEYSNESESAAAEKVNILTSDDLPKRTPDQFWGDHAKVDSPHYKKFNDRLLEEMRKRVQPGDIICHPFGHAHWHIAHDFPDNRHVETGIGYRTTFAYYRVYESFAWMHFHQGLYEKRMPDGTLKKSRGVEDYEWVIPNYFDLADWKPCYAPKKYLLYFGRICPEKGLDIITHIANRVTIPVVICGQGDPTPWKHPNITYIPPIHGDARSKLLGEAMAMLMPTRFTEPFGGAGVEGLLCGTPLLGASSGAFSETVQPGFNGFRCHTLGDWVGAVHRIGQLDRVKIAQDARRKYSLETCGARYKEVFAQVSDLDKDGWRTMAPRNLPRQ